MQRSDIFDIQPFNSANTGPISFKASPGEKKIWMANNGNCIGVMSLLMPDDHYILLSNYRRWQIGIKGVFWRDMLISPYNHNGRKIAMTYMRGQTGGLLQLPYKTRMRVYKEGDLVKMANHWHQPVAEFLPRQKGIEVNVIDVTDDPETLLLSLFGVVYKLLQRSKN